MPRPLIILPDPPPPPTAIGLIAGGGRLPILVAEGLRELGHPVCGLGLARQYEPELPGLCATFKEVGLLKMGRWGRVLRKQGVRHAIMVGRVDKAKLMHDPLRMFRNIPDVTTVRNWYKHLRHDRRSHAILAVIADELDKDGIQLLDSTLPIQDQLSSSGVMTKRAPTPAQAADIDFAWPMLTEALRLDIGQAIAVREKDVIAVEAVEGTDRMIERVGDICKAKGWTLCKGARSGHDRRSDVPTVGMTTIENMAKHRAGCLALAAGDVIMLDRERMIARADELGIAIVGVPVGKVESTTWQQ
ncbi:MAG: LpxI family protein [Phycisphaeraceae bacterium]|nr:UDP-2,3-diacylglucosamine diphosphatase LpxI [Phycisphaerales bacterium]MCB9860524.1 LpxI family protein [Phycisphaeraceae bacterium]